MCAQADPCEHTDLSASQPAVLRRVLARLAVFRQSAVDGPAATHNPDGPGCPGVRTIPHCVGGGAMRTMNCSAKLPCGAWP